MSLCMRCMGREINETSNLLITLPLTYSIQKTSHPLVTPTHMTWYICQQDATYTLNVCRALTYPSLYYISTLIKLSIRELPFDSSIPPLHAFPPDQPHSNGSKAATPQTQ